MAHTGGGALTQRAVVIVVRLIVARPDVAAKAIIVDEHCREPRRLPHPTHDLGSFTMAATGIEFTPHTVYMHRGRASVEDSAGAPAVGVRSPL